MDCRKSMFLVVPLLLSGFVHLWNSTGFPAPTTDEGTYLERAMNVLEGLGAQDPYYGYDHPYFGQLFLASVFNVIGYSDSFNIPNSSNAQVFEILFLVPRALMGMLACKISERTSVLITKDHTSHYFEAAAYAPIILGIVVFNGLYGPNQDILNSLSRN